MEEECEGEYTWLAMNQRSVIDFILKVDEDKQQFDISDHNLLTAYFKIKMKGMFRY